ncbi:hypothetical protein XENTR_v10016824 [Xenopus tropicalis]|nr:hypothetical protein XENTR_v10016824 [Xenopus tropicalis]
MLTDMLMIKHTFNLKAVMLTRLNEGLGLKMESRYSRLSGLVKIPSRSGIPSNKWNNYSSGLKRNYIFPVGG